MEAAPSLRCLVITIQGGQLILPNSLVAEVLPFATPLWIEGAPDWVVGAMLWRNLTTPLVSLARLIYQVPAEADHNSRIIIVSAFGANPRLPYFGLLGTAAPRPINLQHSEIDLDPEAQPGEQLGVLSWASYAGEPAVIPDLDAVEAVLQPLVQRA